MVATESKEEVQAITFQNNFWNAEVGNFTGFEVIVKRTKDGRNISKEYIEFLRQRSIIEEQHGKALLKLSKATWGRDEIGGVRKMWESLRGHTEAVGLAHLKASSQLESEIGKISDFVDSSRDRRRWAEENVRTLQTQLKAAHKKMMDLRKGYEARCREEVQTNHAYYQEVARSGQESGSAEKAALRHSKVRAAMEVAETLYREAAEFMEDIRETWQKETEVAATMFQELETARLSFLRDSVWKLTNIFSATCVADDEVYEETRKVLEQCDLEAGLELFISQHQTGTEKPGAILAESLPSSTTVGMGHARQYDSCSLGRERNFSSLNHLADTGRSRSDLGFSGLCSPSPRKPPRLLTYQPPAPNQTMYTKAFSTNNVVMVGNNNNNNNNSKVGNNKTFHSSTSGRTGRPSSSLPYSVENREYYRLPATTTSYSSDYSDNSLDSSGKLSSASSPPTPSPRQAQVAASVLVRYLPPKSPTPSPRYLTNASSLMTPSPRTRYRAPSPPTPSPRILATSLRRARVLCEYKKNSINEISLARNELVWVVEGREAAEWWRIQTEAGHQGYFPASFLRVMDSLT